MNTPKNTLYIAHQVNPLAPGICDGNFKSFICEHILLIKFMTTCEIGFRWMPQNTINDNGSVQSGNKPLPEPMLTQIYVAI